MSLSRCLKRLAHAVCVGADTPRSLTVAMLLDNDELGQLVNLTTDPSHYLESQVDKYRKDNQCTELLRKLQTLDIPGIDRQARAREAFIASEHACSRTNTRLRPFVTNGPFEDLNDLRLLESFEKMQEWVCHVLGPLPRFLEFSKFGPGATFEDVGRLTTVTDKMSSRPTVTSNGRCLLPYWSNTAWARALCRSFPSRSDPKSVRGNRFTTVPKDALKDRGICIEPSLNVAYQLEVGARIRERLLKVGIDLQHGQDTHRHLAKSFSVSGDYSTIDLSNASDSVSTELVRLLLAKCPGWLALLETLRSPLTRVDGKWYYLNKFSSMGNGFTFELETLIFHAISVEAMRLHGLSEVATGDSCWTYGDDLIVPRASSKTNLALLSYLGFKANPKKTFLTGGFRESCGGDFFFGSPVRAHYIKEEPTSPAQWISIANGLRRADLGQFFGPWSYLWKAWLQSLDHLPIDIRQIRGPSELGDLVIHDERKFWQIRQTPDNRRYIRTWKPVFRLIPFHHWNYDVILAAALFGVTSGTKHSYGIIPRGAVQGYTKRWTPVII
jgi:hypothetical protein